MSNEITESETVESAGGDLALSPSLAIGLSRAEIDTQIETARRFPRSIKLATESILTLATLNVDAASECTYALPRAGKTISGPSVRFAEIIAQSWGNCRISARVVHVDRKEKFIEAEGIYHDLQTNVATLARVRRRISDGRGRLYNDDMVITTGNAACSIARRNAILGGVPKGVWSGAHEQSKKVVIGSVKTLGETRENAVKAFAEFGATAEQVFAALGVAGMEDITLHHILILRSMFSTLRNNEATFEEMFRPQKAVAAHEVVENPLAGDEPAAKESGDGKTAAAPDQAGASADRAPEKAAVDSSSAAAAAPEKAQGEQKEPAAMDKAEEAKSEPENPAREKGRAAARAGRPKSACPTHINGEPTTARDKAHWFAGWDEAKAEKKD